jgi:hypothetical protein
MKTSLVLALLVWAASPALGQESAETVLLLRTASDRGAYHYAEVIHQRGKAIIADVGYIDFDEASAYREFWVGGGAVAIDTKRFTLAAEGLVDKPFGSAAGSAIYLQPWFLARSRISGRLGAEAVYFPYIPLNDDGRAQHVLERAKLEYDFEHLKVGGGYGAYKFADHAWHHKPFVSTTVKGGGLGNLEFWLQRLPGNDLTVQIRYAKVFIH